MKVRLAIIAQILIDDAAAVAVCDPIVFIEPQILLARQGDLFHYLTILISKAKILDFSAYLDPNLPQTISK